MKEPGKQVPGLDLVQHPRRSVTRDVEAPDQTCRNCLHVRFGHLAKAVRNPWGSNAAVADQRVRVIGRVTVFGSPEQSEFRQKIVGILRSRCRGTNRRRSGWEVVRGDGKAGHGQIDLIERRLGVAAAQIGQERWRFQIADAATDCPSRLCFCVPVRNVPPGRGNAPVKSPLMSESEKS